VIAGRLGVGKTISNCTVKYSYDDAIANPTGRNLQLHRKYSRIGGIVGFAQGTSSNRSNIISCEVEEIDIYGNADMGGIVGYTEYTNITDCNASYCYLQLYVAYENRAAGVIVGTAYQSSILRCNALKYSFVDLTGYGGLSNLHPMMGVIVGQIDGGEIRYVGKDSTIPSGIYWEIGLYEKEMIYMGNGPWKVYGRLKGNVTIV
jgi:hypothetical protein